MLEYLSSFRLHPATRANIKYINVDALKKGILSLLYPENY